MTIVVARAAKPFQKQTIAASAGASTLPEHMGLIEDADEAVKIASQIGYPVMFRLRPAKPSHHRNVAG